MANLQYIPWKVFFKSERKIQTNIFSIKKNVHYQQIFIKQGLKDTTQ